MEEKRRLEEELKELLKDDPKVSKALEIKSKIDKIEQKEKQEAKDQEETRIEKLGFTESTIRALRKHKLTTLGKLKNTTITHMTDVGLEKSAINEVRRILGNLGFVMKYVDKPDYPSSEECREAEQRKTLLAKAM